MIDRPGFDTTLEAVAAIERRFLDDLAASTRMAMGIAASHASSQRQIVHMRSVPTSFSQARAEILQSQPASAGLASP